MGSVWEHGVICNFCIQRVGRRNGVADVGLRRELLPNTALQCTLLDDSHSPTLSDTKATFSPFL